MGLVKLVTKKVTVCCTSHKNCYIGSIKLKGLLVEYEKYGTLSIHIQTILTIIVQETICTFLSLWSMCCCCFRKHDMHNSCSEWKHVIWNFLCKNNDFFMSLNQRCAVFLAFSFRLIIYRQSSIFSLLAKHNPSAD